MRPSRYCGACGALVRPECLNAFRELGIVKVHWECWSDCNLPCAFCYRTKGLPLSTGDAQKLVTSVSTSGVETLVFAGGDPSLRPDIGALIRFARNLALQVEVQTNAHHTPKDFLQELQTVQQVGLSIDGADAITHDAFRNKNGNFDRVVSMLQQLNRWGIPVVVRTVIAKSNHANVHLIGQIFQEMENIRRWSLLEFSPVGQGYSNRKNYEIDRTLFRAATDRVREKFSYPEKIDIYAAESKVGTYALITPAGDIYGTGVPTQSGVFPTIGSIVSEHLSVLAEKLPFSKELHRRRYVGITQQDT